MSWQRTYEQIINLSAKSGSPLRRNLTDNAALDAIYWVSRDRFLLRLRFVAEGNSVTAPLEVQELSGDDRLLVIGNNHRAPSANPSLYCAGDFEAGKDERGVYYEGLLSLDTAAGNAQVDGLAFNESLQCLFDFIVLNSANTERFRFQAKVYISKPVWLGDPPQPPDPGAPQYPPPSGLLTLDNLAACGLRLGMDGVQLLNPATNKWHTLAVTGADGQAALAVSASGQD